MIGKKQYFVSGSKLKSESLYYWVEQLSTQLYKPSGFDFLYRYYLGKMKTNNYYPITRVDYPVYYTPIDKWGAEYVIDMEVASIKIICNNRNDVLSVTLEWDKDQDKELYLSLKRHKWKIAWKYRFIPKEE